MYSDANILSVCRSVHGGRFVHRSVRAGRARAAAAAGAAAAHLRVTPTRRYCNYRQVPRPACLTSAQWEIYRVTSRHLDLSFAILCCILLYTFHDVIL